MSGSYRGSGGAGWGTGGDATANYEIPGLTITEAGSSSAPSLAVAEAGIGLFQDSAGVLGVAGDVALPDTYANTTALAANVVLDSNGVLKRSTSSLRYKENISPLGDEDVLRVDRLKAYRYTDRYDPDLGYSVGFIAEQVAEWFPELVTRDPAGAPEAVQYPLVTAVLLHALLDTRRRLAVLEKEVRGGVSGNSEDGSGGADALPGEGAAGPG